MAAVLLSCHLICCQRHGIGVHGSLASMAAASPPGRRLLAQSQAESDDAADLEAEEEEEEERDYENSDKDSAASDQERPDKTLRTRIRRSRSRLVSACCVAQRTAIVAGFFIFVLIIGCVFWWVQMSTEAYADQTSETHEESSDPDSPGSDIPPLLFEDYLDMIGEDGDQDEDNTSYVFSEARTWSGGGNLSAIFHNESDADYMLVQELVGSIWFHSGVPEQYGGSSKGASMNPVCKISGGERCPMSAMLGSASFTNVYPGGSTRCLLDDDLEYAFQVIPGTTDKLLIYFQGGGSCWDQDSANLKLCKQDFQEQPLTGIFDRSQADVPFWDYTIVHVNYCSGDAHAGDTGRDWLVRGRHAEQRGYENALAAVNWAKANTDKHLQSFVIAGCSAGSLGAQIWAKRLLSEFSYSAAAVLADSYAGIFPDGVQGPVLEDSGICHTGLLSSTLAKTCTQKSLTVQDVYGEAMAKFPDVAFSHIMYKTDNTQRAFFTAIHLSIKHTPWALTGAGFYRRLSDIEEFYSRNPNFVLFDMSDDHHCCTDLKRLREAQADGESLLDWLHSFPLEPGDEVHSVCAGERKHPSGWNFGTAHEYCEPEAAERRYRRIKRR